MFTSKAIQVIVILLIIYHNHDPYGLANACKFAQALN